MAEKDQIAKENEESLRAFMDAPKRFDEQQEQAAILFADMVGSTAFKYGHTAIEAMEKTYRHNVLVQAVIEEAEFNGEVVKLLGDGVMAWFSGERAAERAVKAGLRAIDRIEEYNRKEVHPAKWEYKISSHVGIHAGPVWLMKFKQATRVDPQGPTVDLAARLCDAAPAMTVVVNQETFQDIESVLSEAESVRTGPHSRPLKGVPQSQLLYVLTNKSRGPIPLPLPGTITPLPEHLRTELSNILSNWRNHRDNACVQTETIRALKAFLEKEPFGFEANYRLAELLTHERGDGRPLEQRASDAADCLRKCKAEHPESAELWKLLSWVYYRWFLSDPQSRKKKLDQAVGYARHALSLAEALMDEHGAATAKIYLIIYLNERIRCCLGDRNSDFGYASRYVKEVEPLIQTTGPGSWLLSNYYVGCAMTELARNNSPSEEVLDLLQEAFKHYKRNGLAAMLQNELLNGGRPANDV